MMMFKIENNLKGIGPQVVSECYQNLDPPELNFVLQGNYHNNIGVTVTLNNLNPILITRRILLTIIKHRKINRFLINSQ